MELVTGIEPVTSSLPRKCSTTELHERISWGIWGQNTVLIAFSWPEASPNQRTRCLFPASLCAKRNQSTWIAPRSSLTFRQRGAIQVDQINTLLQSVGESMSRAPGVKGILGKFGVNWLALSEQSFWIN